MKRPRHSVSWIQKAGPKFFRQSERFAMLSLGRIIKDRLAGLESLTAFALDNRRPNVVVPGEERQDTFMSQYINQAWIQGLMSAAMEIRRMQARQFNDPPAWWANTSNLESVEWASRRTVLLGKWHRDLDAEINRVITLALDNGENLKATMKALRVILPKFTKLRLENIVRTETSSAYNQGRLSGFRKSEVVGAVQFTAVIDARTTDICKKRDGLIMELSDKRLQANTPPLHFMCRSVLVPVDKFDLEDLKKGDEGQQDYYFGWIENGPRNWREATSAWDDAPLPLAGFGAL